MVRPGTCCLLATLLTLTLTLPDYTSYCNTRVRHSNNWKTKIQKLSLFLGFTLLTSIPTQEASASSTPDVCLTEGCIGAIPYHTIPYHTIPYHTTVYHTIPYHTKHTKPYCPISLECYISELTLKCMSCKSFCKYHIIPYRNVQ